MSSPLRLGTVAGTTAEPRAGRPPQTVEAAAKQFEGIMIEQLLKAARGDEGGWLAAARTPEMRPPPDWPKSSLRKLWRKMAAWAWALRLSRACPRGPSRAWRASAPVALPHFG